MKKYIFLIFFLFFIKNAFAQKQIGFLLGNWKVVKTVSIDQSIPVTREEFKECFGKTITFFKDRIVTPKGLCFYNPCVSPNYEFKRVEALEYVHNNSEYLKALEYKDKMIDVVETACDVPFRSIKILSNEKIAIAADGYIYILERVQKAKSKTVSRNSQ